MMYNTTYVHYAIMLTCSWVWVRGWVELAKWSYDRAVKWSYFQVVLFVSRYCITWSGNEVVGNGSMLRIFVEPIKLQQFVTYTFQRFGHQLLIAFLAYQSQNHTQSVIGRYFQVSVRPRWCYGSCVRKTTVGYLTLCRSQHKPRWNFPRVV